jgi:hypothetical protein
MPFLQAREMYLKRHYILEHQHEAMFSILSALISSAGTFNPLDAVFLRSITSSPDHGSFWYSSITWYFQLLKNGLPEISYEFKIQIKRLFIPGIISRG